MEFRTIRYIIGQICPPPPLQISTYLYCTCFPRKKYVLGYHFSSCCQATQTTSTQYLATIMYQCYRTYFCNTRCVDYLYFQDNKMTQNYKTQGKMGYMLFCDGAIVDMIKSERVCWNIINEPKHLWQDRRTLVSGISLQKTLLKYYMITLLKRIARQVLVDLTDVFLSDDNTSEN